MLRILAVLAAISVSSPTVAGETTANECDGLAAHPYDPVKQAQGVVFDEIDSVRAPMMCAAALFKQPDVIRYKYQYGRALLAADRPIEAMIFLRSAANSGYAAAEQTLATILYEDQVLSTDKIKAIRLFHKAAAQGHAVARLRVASFYLLGDDGVRDHSKARRLIRQAADQGLPAARTALKMIDGTTVAQNGSSPSSRHP